MEKRRAAVHHREFMNMKKRRAVVHHREFILGLFVLIIVGIVSLCFLLFGGMRTQAAPAEISYKYYTNIQVQKGDTLWDIAKTYMTEEYSDINDYIKEVRRINHISDDNIKSGQYITVPYYSKEYLN